MAAPRSERLKIAPVMQKALVILLPEVVGDYQLPPSEVTSTSPKPSLDMLPIDKILYAIHMQGLTISKMEQVTLPAEKGSIIFGEGEVATTAARGPSIVLLVEGDHAVLELKELIGPKSVTEAKESAPTRYVHYLL